MLNWILCTFIGHEWNWLKTHTRVFSMSPYRDEFMCNRCGRRKLATIYKYVDDENEQAERSADVTKWIILSFLVLSFYFLTTF